MSRSESYGIQPSDDMYSLWSIKLLETFFSPASKGDEVWLQVDPEELDSIGPELGGDEGFLNAVRAGPSWGTVFRYGRFVQGETTDLLYRVKGLVLQRQQRQWRPSSYIDPGDCSLTYRAHDAPTYLPYLVALVRSASLAEDGFYGHLRAALKLHEDWGTHEMVGLEVAWKDLENWTRATNGEFGRFRFRSLGGYPHIGVPRSQSIMSRRDCELMPRVFAQVGARPGQQFTRQLVDDMKLHAANSSFLSAGFKKALNHPHRAFDEPITARLKALFEEWDGKIPLSAVTHGGETSNAGVVGEREDIQLCLSLQEGNSLSWNLHWRVPPLRDTGEIILVRGGIEWTAPVWGTEPATTTNDDCDAIQAAACSALSASSCEDVEFSAALLQDGGARANLGSIFLREAILRVLVWGYDAFHQRNELHEHVLPLNGPAFLLAAEKNTGHLRDWLTRENIDHEPVSTAGLPEGWILICVLDCSALTQEQRNLIPDGASEREQHRVIRLLGGRSVRRAGIKQYMSYDLPIVELDAPVGTELRASGLVLQEEVTRADPAHRSGIRRFHVTPENLGPRSFAIRAELSGYPLSCVTLRVAPDSGEQVEIGQAFSLDPQGNPMHDDRGLRGVLVPPATTGTAVTPRSFVLSSRDLGRLLQPGDLARMQSSVPLQFLDTLAQVGSMAYGPARDQLIRLSAKSQSRISPSMILLDLRSRGHLEIETNTKGHLARIYAVPPSLYELPIKVEGQPVFGVLGTLRYQQWGTLAESTGDIYIYHRGVTDGYLDVWRILVRDTARHENAANASGLSILGNPALPIAEWAATCEAVRARIEQVAGESLGAHVQYPEKLNPNTGCFFSVPEVRLSEGPACQLFRMEDRDTGKLQVYTLGTTRGGSLPRYGFVRDSRWGIWITLNAFADFVKQAFGISDASPWPIPYVPDAGILFLPARVSLPVVLERVLNLCSGSGPDPVEVEAVSLSQSQQIALMRKADRVIIANVSRVYEGMASGKWLAYKYVPQEIATIIARKVCASIVNS